MLARLKSLFDTLANMGVWIRLNDARTEPPTEEGRAWGDCVEGFQLSVAAVSPLSLSILLKNRNDRATKAPSPKYEVKIDAPLKSYGRAVQNAPRSAAIRTFAPNASVASDLPLAALYELRPGLHTVSVSCQVPGGSDALQSNTLQLLVQ